MSINWPIRPMVILSYTNLMKPSVLCCLVNLRARLLYLMNRGGQQVSSQAKKLVSKHRNTQVLALFYGLLNIYPGVYLCIIPLYSLINWKLLNSRLGGAKPSSVCSQICSRITPSILILNTAETCGRAISHPDACKEVYLIWGPSSWMREHGNTISWFQV
jgi:hypothetical protein